ncbi:DUF1775 domain-containing protein [Couchioplanes caeruleus]|uniref:YncI copper-binding domain-containing protein n=2 Tax=Couchioplanes caeruleus TaxID=56438 RepID=A0A1K0FM58_9ACTN|nr:DUF1775 domain-containing protein [Couchioplanes caeruleus]OJF13933.1 hypothetical protein BG844_12595 [Couchioplanes caeruleus subsp. caeruleus]ROP34369.1 uncharacterized protein DUF1775 [Couchioplanes caeruleus]
MSRLEKHRRAGVLAAAVAAGVLGVAAPAAAGVTVSPPSAPQGSGQNVAFKVTNAARSPITKIKLVLPRDMPIAEFYALSAPDWAPQLEYRKLDTPLTSIHGGSPVTEATSAITWTAMPGKALAPGKSADLSVAMGPLPTTGDKMSFTLSPTYADPAKGAPIPPVTLALTPATAGGTAGHPAHGTTPGGGTSADDAAMFAALAEAADDGPGFWTVAGWVVAGLLAAAGAVMVRRARRRPAPDAADEAPAGEAKELVATGPRVTAWSYKDGPEE